MTDVAVIIPAAGSGTRLGGLPKQFRPLAEEPLLHRTIRRFDRIGEIGRMVVLVPAESVVSWDRELSQLRPDAITVAAGGSTRQESVRQGLAHLASDIRFVLVHDAARPFVSADEITAVISATRRYGAAALAIPVADTLRACDGEKFAETIDRKGIYRMQTPQGFTKGLIVEAHEWASRTGYSATDDVELVTRRGQVVRLVEGRSTNFKITTAEDWALAEAVIETAALGRSE